MRTFFILLMAFTFLIYVTFVYINYGILQSISESDYSNKESGKLWRKNLFTYFSFIVGICAIIIGYYDYSLLLQLSGAMLMLVSVTPEFKIKYVKNRHLISAYSAVILSQLAIFFDYNFLEVNVLFVMFVIFSLIFKKSIQEIFWIEVVSFISIIIALV